MAKDTKKKATTKTDELTEKSVKARKKMNAYLKENKLDPKKDWTKHKTHGPILTKWIKIIQLGESAADKAITKKAIDKKLSKPDVHPKKKTVTTAPTSYDYPDVDGKPMTPEQKKKYRAKMRSLAKSKMDPKEASKKALASLSGVTSKPVKEKTGKKEVKEEKTSAKTTKSGSKSSSTSRDVKKDKKSAKKKTKSTKSSKVDD